MHLKKHLLHFLFSSFILSLINNHVSAQSFLERSHVGLGFGAMQYQGDIPKQYTKFAIQGSYSYELTNHINIRGQAFFGSVGASDNPDVVNPAMDRPHPFDSRIQEVSVLGEYNLFNLNDGKKWTPYAFIGLGFFHFTPYYTEYNATDNRFYNYKYTISSSKKLNVPFGFGLKYAINDNIRLFAEGNYRYTTSDEIDGYQPTDFPNYSRSKINDYFVSGVIGISFRLGGNYKSDNSTGGKSRYNSKKCPPVY